MMKKHITLILLLFIGTVNLMGQTKKAYLSAAQTAYENEDYYSAFSYYKEVLEFKNNDIQTYYNAANAARMFNAYTFADTLYAQVLEEEDNNQFPDAIFYAAQIKQKLGEYEKAKEYYSLYISEQGGDDPILTSRAVREIEAVEWAAEEMENYELEDSLIKRLDGVNTPYSDFGAFKIEDILYYSSLQFEQKGDKEYPDKIYSRILTSENAGSGDIFGESLSPSPRKHLAHTSFNEDYTRMYYTLCEYNTPVDIRCDIHYVAFEDGEIVGESEQINFEGALESETYTQPSWGILNDSTEVLFFSSDREGGQGLNDLWYSEILENGAFGTPVNLKEINSQEDDITPFYDRNTGILYFSTDGNIGFGGYDIFYTQEEDNGWAEPINMGAPLNTSYDDIYPMIDPIEDDFYFSSNRPGSLYLEDRLEGCCYDIYEGEMPFFRHNLLVQVLDGYTKDSVYGAEVLLKNHLTNEGLDSLQDDNLAEYKFRIQKNKEYEIVGDKEDYLPGRTFFSTIGVLDTGDIVKQVYLVTKVLHLDVFVFDGMDSTALRGAEVTLVDDMGNTVDTINLNSNDFHFELDRDRQYTVVASRKGYSPVMVKIDPSEYADQSLITRNLYLPIGTLKDFLPLVLYFDNDRPNPRTWTKTTDTQYTETFPPYYERKDVFISEFGEPLSGNELQQAKEQLENFFDTEVKKGNMDLGNFLTVLERTLEEGKNVEIYLKGYASPRAGETYNFNLGMRRVQSVKNDLVDFNDGALEKYLESGQLELRLKSFGKTTAPGDVISDLNDRRNSIYSYKASKERRVEIIGINIEE